MTESPRADQVDFIRLDGHAVRAQLDVELDPIRTARHSGPERGDGVLRLPRTRAAVCPDLHGCLSVATRRAAGQAQSVTGMVGRFRGSLDPVRGRTGGFGGGRVAG